MSVTHSLLFVTLAALFGLGQNTWTPLPVDTTGAPPMPAHPGNFEYKLTKKAGKPDEIEIRWKPPAAGAPCAVTVLVQTVKLHFINNDGTKETLGKKSDLWNGVDLSTWPAKVRKKLEDDKKKDQTALDPDATTDGTFVDHHWCDQDAAMNGNDVGSDKGKKGNRTTPTRGSDKPELGEGFFSGKRTKFVAEFEVCAYCFDPNTGFVGQALGCMTWTFEREKGKSPGKITVPNQKTKKPSASHTAAVTKFQQRHRLRLPDGTFVAICPEESTAQLRKEIKELQDSLKELAGLISKEAEAEIKRQIKIRTEQIRQRRKRR